MHKLLKPGLMLMLAALMAACTGTNPYGDPDDQRDRAKAAQEEMRRDTSQ